MKIFVSIGDPNGIGLEIALRSHPRVKDWGEIVYGVDEKVLFEASQRLGIGVPQDMECDPLGLESPIAPGVISKEAGRYSFESFKRGVERAKKGEVRAIVTLPVHKKAWSLAGIPYAGHTEALREMIGEEAIMMMGKEGFFIALYTDHLPLSEVPQRVHERGVEGFLRRLSLSLPAMKACGVLGLNPHAGDQGVLGKEEEGIKRAIEKANQALGRELFFGPLVPDVAFIPSLRAKFDHYVAMYHDQGLIALKILYFEESINLSLGLPFIRTSVDHGTAFDIAYKGGNPSLLSYQNAIKMALKLGSDKR